MKKNLKLSGVNYVKVSRNRDSSCTLAAQRDNDSAFPANYMPKTSSTFAVELAKDLAKA